MFILLGLSRRQLSRIEQIVLAILELDMMNALRLICSSGQSKSWFAVHLVDLLHFHDPSFLNTTTSISSCTSIPKNPKVYLPKEEVIFSQYIFNMLFIFRTQTFSQISNYAVVCSLNILNRSFRTTNFGKLHPIIWWQVVLEITSKCLTD